MTQAEYERLTAPADLAVMRARLTPERRNAYDAWCLSKRLARIVIFAQLEGERHAQRRYQRAAQRAAARAARRMSMIFAQPSQTPPAFMLQPATGTRAAANA